MNKYEKAFYNYQVDSSTLKSNTNGKWGSTTKDDEKLLQELVERATPMKPSDLQEDDVVWWQCPKCNGDTTDDNQIQYNFCPICGQALLWEDNQ